MRPEDQENYEDIIQMFAALSQYEVRFQQIERSIAKNTMLLDRVDRVVLAIKEQIAELRKTFEDLCPCNTCSEPCDEKKTKNV